MGKCWFQFCLCLHAESQRRFLKVVLVPLMKICSTCSFRGWNPPPRPVSQCWIPVCNQQRQCEVGNATRQEMVKTRNMRNDEVVVGNDVHAYNGILWEIARKRQIEIEAGLCVGRVEGLWVKELCSNVTPELHHWYNTHTSCLDWDHFSACIPLTLLISFSCCLCLFVTVLTCSHLFNVPPYILTQTWYNMLI